MKPDGSTLDVEVDAVVVVVQLLRAVPVEVMLLAVVSRLETDAAETGQSEALYEHGG